MLPFYARTFPAVEIDSSAYGVPSTRSVASMVGRTPAAFRFSFKAPQTVTHPTDLTSPHVHDDAKLLLESVQPALDAGKLACILAQFPNGFKPEGPAERYLERTIEAFEGVPVVVEFRNRQWQQPQTLEFLRERGAAYCNVDVPSYETLPHASSEVTAGIAYVRMHGRNAKAWWRGTNVTRYDYLYAAEELEPWADRVAEIEAQAAATYVFFNNHSGGKAARNAEMFEALLDERYGERADDVVAHALGGNPEQQGLFGEL